VHGVLLIHAGSGDEPARKAGLAGAAGAAGVDTTLARGRELTALAHDLVGRLSRNVRFHQTSDFDERREAWTRDLRRPRLATRAAYSRDLRAALYGADHPYAAGEATPETLARISGGDIAAFKRRYHVAANATLILTGQFDTARMRQHVEYQFGALSEHAPERTPLPAADRPTEATFLAHDAKDDSSPVVELDALFLGAAGIDGDYAARLVAERMIAGELRALREERAITYGMTAAYEPRRGQGLWRISGTADAARAAEAAAALRELMFDLHANARDMRGSFALARRGVIDDLVLDASSPQAIVARLAFIARFDLADDFYVRLAERVARVTVDEVAAVIDRELAPETGIYGVLGPRAAAIAGVEAAKRVRGAAPAATPPAAAAAPPPR
jgi:zinc protease